MQPIVGNNADEIAKECPGLFEVQGSGKSRQAKVKAARDYPQLLEKVKGLDSLNCKLALAGRLSVCSRLLSPTHMRQLSTMFQAD